MAEWFESGRIVEWIVAGMVLEALAFAALAARRRDVPLAGLTLNLAAGACLLLALRAVLAGAAWTGAAAWLSLALVAHVGDLIVRFSGARSAAGRGRGG